MPVNRHHLTGSNKRGYVWWLVHQSINQPIKQSINQSHHRREAIEPEGWHATTSVPNNSARWRQTMIGCIFEWGCLDFRKNLWLVEKNHWLELANKKTEWRGPSFYSNCCWSWSRCCYTRIMTSLFNNMPPSLQRPEQRFCCREPITWEKRP